MKCAECSHSDVCALLLKLDDALIRHYLGDITNVACICKHYDGQPEMELDDD